MNKISIITPSFNQGKFIEKTILSVIEQPYENIEYIIIDGGSTDNTLDIIKKYEDRIDYWVSEPDNGQSSALNKGFSKATGDVLAWINSDDYYELDIFDKVMKKFTDPDVYILNGNCMMHYADSETTFIDKPGLVNTSRMLRYWRPFFCPPQPSIFFRREVWVEVCPLDESLNYSMDLDLWLKMSLRNKFTFYNEVLSHYLIHDSSKSGSEGGFKKFVPEWRKVAFKYLWKSGIRVQLSFWQDYLRHDYLRNEILQK